MSYLPTHQHEQNKLPILSFKENILNLLRVNNVIIVQGPTGCGKTTQIPQYILKDSMKKTQVCNIVVVLPTKIAAVNIASRVCEEGGFALGTVCGYDLGLEKKASCGSLLTFMPTSILLQQIISAKSLDQFTHIFIDDFQERSQELDFLLLVVKRFLSNNLPKTKVILMSAQNDVDAEIFAHYFGTQNVDKFCLPAPIICVSKGTDYTSSVSYIEDVCNVIGKSEQFAVNFDEPQISASVWNIFVCLVSAFDKIDEINSATNQRLIGNVLVFLPGIKELYIARNHLLKYNRSIKREKQTNLSRNQLEVILLHSSITIDLQAVVCEPPSLGYRKVIVSTSVAENSITLPGVHYVIDFCQTKIMRVDPLYKYYGLNAEWASHVNCEQRAGRVGRTENGKVYRLVSKQFYEEKMPKWAVPKILLAPLDRLVLQAKMLGINECPREILASAMYPPIYDIDNAILALKEIGGLLPTRQGLISNSDGDLTFLGTVMASLPIDVRLSKLIVLGHLFGCLEEATIIAAGCSIPENFPIPPQQKFSAYKKRPPRADGSSSDFLDVLSLYQVCKKDKANNPWNIKSVSKFKEWKLLVIDIRHRLEQVNIKCTTGPDSKMSYNDKAPILNIISAGAFYPNYFVYANEKLLKENAPLKMGLRGCISSSSNKIIDIDCKSVNKGLLDAEPENVHTRLLAAGYVSQRDCGQRWTLHQTCLLPNIPGLPMLLPLLFCPTMRVKLTEDGMRVSSILCGSGYNKYTRRANYQLHDLTFTLDTELTQDEGDKINNIRSYMSKGIQLMSECASKEELVNNQKCLKKELRDLIFTPRKLVDRVNVKSVDDWRENDNVIHKPDICRDETDIWPRLPFVELNHIPADDWSKI